jgi:hypothetical protein
LIPARSGVALDNGADAVTEASTAELLAWLRARRVPEGSLREVEAMDHVLRGFQQAVLRYGLVKALIEKGYDVPYDAALWHAYDAAMRARVG